MGGLGVGDFMRVGSRLHCGLQLLATKGEEEMKCPKCGQEMNWKGFRARSAVRVTYECPNGECGYKSKPGYGETVEVANEEAKLLMANENDGLFEFVVSRRGAGKILYLSRLAGLLRDENEKLKSTYSQVSKALCGKENATLDELLQTVDQLKRMIER